jgi:8-oxo-dGTP pyrophosphatase MutT (NUDIX family)
VSQHADARRVLDRWRAPDEAQEQLRRQYVAHLDAFPDGCEKPCFPDHLTAGALVLGDDGEQVLLNLHRKAGRWFAFGGHLEPGDATLAAAALREATEESGLVGLAVDPEPVHLSRHPVDFCSPRGRVHHLDVRYLAVVPAGTEPVLSAESVELRWFPVDELPTDEPDMLELVTLARQRFAQSQGPTSSSAAAATPSR